MNITSSRRVPAVAAATRANKRSKVYKTFGGECIKKDLMAFKTEFGHCNVPKTNSRNSKHLLLLLSLFLNLFDYLHDLISSHLILFITTQVWRLPGDMAHFKRVTYTLPSPQAQETSTDNTNVLLELTNAAIMGRKTWESIP